MTQSIFQETLVEIEPLQSVIFGVRVFFEEFLGYQSAFVLFLNKTENLVNLVRNDVSILIDLIF